MPDRLLPGVSSASPRQDPLQGWFKLFSRRILPAAVLLFCAACCAGVFAEIYSRLFLLGEAGPGDLYVYHTVRKFETTGMIYQRTAEEPSPVYGPLLYILLALPGRSMTGDNPLFAPRVIQVVIFLLCIAAVGWITRALIPHRGLWLWSLPLAMAFPPMLSWVLQLRGDFVSVLFSLIAIRLLLSKRLSLSFLAGASGGFATLFKLNYIAALVAGLVWLVFNRRWKALFLFGLGGAITFVGIYSFYTLREPGMAKNVTALRRPILDLVGDIQLILHLAHEPIALLALSVLPFLRWKWRNGWTLLVLYAAISFSIGAILDLQIGGAENYFFEFLFSLVPFAALAVLELQNPRLRNRWALLALFAVIAFGIAAVTQLPPGAGRNSSVVLLAAIASLGAARRRQPAFAIGGLSLATLLVIWLTIPVASSALTAARLGPEVTRAHNVEMTAFQSAVRDQSVLTFVPGLAFFTPDDFLPDPWGLTYGEYMGTFDYHPLARRIQSQNYDMIVTPRVPDSHRGLPLLSPTLRPAIGEAYEPFCSLHNWVMFLRRNSTGQETLRRQLVELGCDAGSCVSGTYCRSW